MRMRNKNHMDRLLNHRLTIIQNRGDVYIGIWNVCVCAWAFFSFLFSGVLVCGTNWGWLHWARRVPIGKYHAMCNITYAFNVIFIWYVIHCTRWCFLCGLFTHNQLVGANISCLMDFIAARNRSVFLCWTYVTYARTHAHPFEHMHPMLF